MKIICAINFCHIKCIGICHRKKNGIFIHRSYHFFADNIRGRYADKYVSADKYKDLEKQLGKVNSALTEKTTEYDTLKEKAGDNAELKAEIERLKAENTNTVNSLKDDYEKQLKRSTVINEIQNKYHPKDVNDIIPHIDMEKISVENDNIVGLTEQITPLTESKAYLFGNEPQRNKSGLEHDDKDYDTARLEAAFGITKKE